MSLNEFYTAIGKTKQGVHDMLNRMMRKRELSHQLLILVHQIRRDHPTMGVREMYFKLNPEGIGRDQFEELFMSLGFRTKRVRNYRRTTDSQGVKRFDNLLTELEVGGMNQLWQSDITYYEIKGRFYYITLIQDAYTKVIVGYTCSSGMQTKQTTLKAIKMALGKYEKQEMEGLIFHSDGGGQYYAKQFRKLTQEYGIKNSMGKSCYENAMAESLNGVIKNKYLKHFNIDSFEKLEKELDRVVQLYNHDKPHSGLKRLTPSEFEKRCLNLDSQTKAKMIKSIDAKVCKDEASSLHLTGQTKALNQISSLQR